MVEKGEEGDRRVKPLTGHTVPAVFILQRQGLCPLVDVVLNVLEVLSSYSVGHTSNVLFLHPGAAE